MADRFPESSGREAVTADLALLKIKAVHSEAGTVLGDPNLDIDDFVLGYWPEAIKSCGLETPAELGTKVDLLGFDADAESAASLKGEVDVLLPNGFGFVANTTPSFSGASVIDSESGCFSGIALAPSQSGERHRLVNLNLLRDWLSGQGINLPLPALPEGGI